MIRTLVAIFVIGISVLIVPLWLQYSLFVVSIISVRHKIFILVPAIFADALYTPSAGMLAGYTNTIIVAVLLIVYTFIMTKTRIGTVYGVAK